MPKTAGFLLAVAGLLIGDGLWNTLKSKDD